MPPTVPSCVFYSLAEHYFADSIFPQYVSNDNVILEGVAAGGTCDTRKFTKPNIGRLSIYSVPHCHVE